MKKCIKIINALHYIGDSHTPFIAYYLRYV